MSEGGRRSSLINEGHPVSTRVTRKPIKGGPKSCQKCRKSKQRCDLPNRNAIQPSDIAQPLHLACHRCKVLNFDCIVEVPLFETSKDSTSSQNQIDATSSDETDHASKRRRSTTSAQWSSYQRTSSVDSQRSTENSNIDQAARSNVDQRNYSRDFHLFEPDINGRGYREEISSAGRKVGMEGKRADTSPEAHYAIVSSRPFPYLTRLCKIQPGFLDPSIRHIENSEISVGSIIHHYEEVINWSEMNKYLSSFQLFAPFLEVFHLQNISLDRAGIWLATCLYLASTRSNLLELQVDLFQYLRQETLACLKRGPATMGEAAALAALSLYEPLLTANDAEQIQLDGFDMLAASSSTVKSLGFDTIAIACREANRGSGESLNSTIRLCALNISIAYYSSWQMIMGSVHKESLLQHSSSDIAEVELFCRNVLGSNHQSKETSEYASLLLLLLFRYRSIQTLQKLNQGQCTKMGSLSSQLSVKTEHTLRLCIKDLGDTAADLANEVQDLRYLLQLDSERCDIYLDYLEVELKQLLALCYSNLQDICVLQVNDQIGRKTSISSLVQYVLPNQDALRFISIIGIPKAESCRKVSILLGNFIDRWTMPSLLSKQIKTRSLPFPPPAYFCALILPTIKTICDAAAASFLLGLSPPGCLVDGELDMAASLIRKFAHTLLQFSQANQINNSSAALFHTKGHYDIMEMVARISSRTSQAIHEWHAGSKGLRSSSSRPSKIHLPFTLRHDGDSLSALPNDHRAMTSQLDAHADTTSPHLASLASTKDTHSSIPAPIPNTEGLDFERLLQDILSTPIAMSEHVLDDFAP